MKKSSFFFLLFPFLISILSNRIIHESGFTSEDFKQYRPVVYSNTIQSLVAILRAMPNLSIQYGNNEREVSASNCHFISRWPQNRNFAHFAAKKISSLRKKWIKLWFNMCAAYSHSFARCGRQQQQSRSTTAVADYGHTRNSWQLHSVARTGVCVGVGVAGRSRESFANNKIYEESNRHNVV